jgi:FkbM family methyltransferase
LVGRNPLIQLLKKAVGAKGGQGKLLVSQANPTVSSLSEAWVEQVGSSPGFSSVRWEANELVEMTTLDALIEEFGLPSFCKLDVEGYEYEALMGLGQPIETISFEYIPAAIKIAIACIEYLEKLGGYQFNIVEGERPQFSQPDWINGDEMSKKLLDLEETGRAGEVYARLKVGT